MRIYWLLVPILLAVSVVSYQNCPLKAKIIEFNAVGGINKIIFDSL